MNAIRLNTKLISSLSAVLFIPATEIMQATGIASTTWYAIIQKPAGITIQQLIAISNGIHIPVRRFFSTGKADLIGHRDDYVTDPYLPCYYDANALQELVSSRQEATWQRAADATGVSRDNLKKSLLGVRRTPVIRFLTACNAFSIDPFEILIDPNPIFKKETVKPSKASFENTRAEISQLQQDMKALSESVMELSKKYEELISAYDALLRQINTNIHNFTDSNPSIAADPREDK